MSSELSQQDLEHFGSELRKLLGQAAHTRDQVEGEYLGVGGEGLDTQGDAGADREFEEVDLDVIEAEDATAQAAVAALKRISDGTYGRCASCGDWIPRGRLEVVPYTTHCVACQEAQEEQNA